MKKTFLLILVCVALSIPALSQQQELVPLQEAVQGQVDSSQYELMDSVIYVPVARVDTALAGVDVFSILPDGSDGGARVSVNQSDAVAQALALSVAANKERPIKGYRVRIFFKESARAESEEVVKKFTAKYPGVPAYRSYANPYFKVTVGDFRGKSEAMQLMEKVIKEYPTAFVVKENIRYPVVDKNNTYAVDTLKVLKTKALPQEDVQLPTDL